MLGMSVALLALLAPGADADKKAPPAPAQVVLTAQVACLHCDFGEGDGCAACLKIDDNTPVKLAGKIAENLQEDRFSKRIFTVEGVLSMKDKRMTLTGAKSKAFDDKNPGDSPGKGVARIVGPACCASCDLKLTDDCTLAVVNAGSPIVLEGKLAAQHCEAEEQKQLTTEGRLFVDKQGLLRLAATRAVLTVKEEKK